MKGSSIQPPPNPKEKDLEIPPRKGSENHQKGETRKTHPSLEEPRQIIYIYTKEVHTRSSLSPDHPFLSQDLTMKLSS
jgi:hypothetical protein